MDVYHQLSSYMKELGLQINSEQLAKFVTVAMRKQQDPVLASVENTQK